MYLDHLGGHRMKHVSYLPFGEIIISSSIDSQATNEINVNFGVSLDLLPLKFDAGKKFQVHLLKPEHTT